MPGEQRGLNSALYAFRLQPYTPNVGAIGLPGLQHHFLRTVAILCSFVALFPAAALPQQLPQTEKSEPKPSAEKAPENPAQIELLETRIRFEANGDSRKEVHARVHINNELGVRQFARLNFDYNRSFESVEIPLVHIAHPSGGSADILPSAITDNPNPAVVNYPAYHDVRVKSVRILGLEPGDLLEYRVITTVSHHPLAPDFWLDHSFDRTGVVTEEIFALDLPGHLNSTATMGNWHGGSRLVVYLTVQHTSYRYDPSQGASGRSIYRWELPSTRKLPAPVDDGGAPAPDVLVSSFPTWFELVTRLAPHLLNWPADDRKEAEARLRSFAPTARTPDKMLRASYELVSQKLLTVDLPVGATGFRLRHVKEILDSGYATPEEKCSLLAQFASVAGITAEIVFVGTPETQKQFARPYPFNHVFLIVSEKNKHIVLDPSMEVAPFGLIAPQFRRKPALSLALVDGDNYMSANWSPLPAELPFPASQCVSVEATLSADGTLRSKVRYSLRGDNELLLRLAFHQAPKEKWKEIAQLLALSDGFRGQVTNLTAADPYATREPFTVDYEITQPKFVDWSKKPVRVPALLPQLGLPDPPSKPAPDAAASPIELGTPLEVQTSVTLHLPPGATAQVPTGTSVNRDYASFSSQYSARGQTITATRHINFLLREIPAARTADYNAFLHAVQSDQAQLFTIVGP